MNSPGTEIFPFSYFAFTLLKLRKVIKDIKIINIFDKTRRHALDFGRESSYRNHNKNDDIHSSSKGKMSFKTPLAPGELNKVKIQFARERNDFILPKSIRLTSCSNLL